MKTYISILRGINVSGHKKILMNDLKNMYENIGFQDVITYIQSGNVIFKTNLKTTNTQLAKLIEDELKLQFGFDIPVIIRTIDDLKNMIILNPFSNEQIDKLYITLLSNIPNTNNLEQLNLLSFLPDKFKIIDKEIYLSVVSYGNTKLSNNFFENILKITATTRNIKTINKLIELANV